MMTSEEVLSSYEAMAALTTQMVVAAGNSEWDRFMQLEQRCALHVAALKQNDTALAMQGAAREKKVALIKKLLADDRKIRDLTTPWMAQLAALINNTHTERRLASAYGRA
jgi:flagellar protein FliT